MGVDPKIQAVIDAEAALERAKAAGESTADAQKQFDAANQDLLKND